MPVQVCSPLSAQAKYDSFILEVITVASATSLLSRVSPGVLAPRPEVRSRPKRTSESDSRASVCACQGPVSQHVGSERIMHHYCSSGPVLDLWVLARLEFQPSLSGSMSKVG